MWRAKIRAVILVPGTRTQNIHLLLHERCPHFDCNLHALRNTLLQSASHIKTHTATYNQFGQACIFANVNLSSQQTFCTRITDGKWLMCQLCCFTHSWVMTFETGVKISSTVSFFWIEFVVWFTLLQLGSLVLSYNSLHDIHPFLKK